MFYCTTAKLNLRENFQIYWRCGERSIYRLSAPIIFYSFMFHKAFHYHFSVTFQLFSCFCPCSQGHSSHPLHVVYHMCRSWSWCLDLFCKWSRNWWLLAFSCHYIHPKLLSLALLNALFVCVQDQSISCCLLTTYSYFVVLNMALFQKMASLCHQRSIQLHFSGNERDLYSLCHRWICLRCCAWELALHTRGMFSTAFGCIFGDFHCSFGDLASLRHFLFQPKKLFFTILEESLK